MNVIFLDSSLKMEAYREKVIETYDKLLSNLKERFVDEHILVIPFNTRLIMPKGFSDFNIENYVPYGERAFRDCFMKAIVVTEAVIDPWESVNFFVISGDCDKYSSTCFHVLNKRIANQINSGLWNFTFITKCPEEISDDQYIKRMTYSYDLENDKFLPLGEFVLNLDS